MANATVRFIIKRKANPRSAPYWEELDLRLRHVPQRTVALTPGKLLVLNTEVPHDVEAVEDSCLSADRLRRRAQGMIWLM